MNVSGDVKTSDSVERWLSVLVMLAYRTSCTEHRSSSDCVISCVNRVSDTNVNYFYISLPAVNGWELPQRFIDASIDASRDQRQKKALSTIGKGRVAKAVSQGCRRRIGPGACPSVLSVDHIDVDFSATKFVFFLQNPKLAGDDIYFF